jgi:hypothetical protein
MYNSKTVQFSFIFISAKEFEGKKMLANVESSDDSMAAILVNLMRDSFTKFVEEPHLVHISNFYRLLGEITAHFPEPHRPVYILFLSVCASFVAAQCLFGAYLVPVWCIEKSISR